MIQLIGVPFNSAGRSGGVGRAPEALRRAGLVETLGASGREVIDRGDLELGPTSPERDASTGMIAPQALMAMIDRVRGAVAGSRSDHAFALVLGGDCPVLLGCLRAFGGVDDGPGLLFVDGHEDAWPPARSTTGETADMELGLALGLTTHDLPLWLNARLPRIDASRVAAIGPRDRDEIAEAGITSIDGVVEVVRPEALGDLERIVDAAIERVSAGGPWWLHVDLDVLSTASLAAVGYPQPGGIDWDQLTGLTRRALRAHGIAGCDVTIYDPDLDPAGAGAARITRYLADSLG